MDNDKLTEMIQDIVDKAKKGEKIGNSKCPYCGGTVNYAYENGMAMRAKCVQCGFYLMA